MRELTTLLEALTELLDPASQASRAEALLSVHAAAYGLAAAAVDNNDCDLIEATRNALRAAGSSLSDA